VALMNLASGSCQSLLRSITRHTDIDSHAHIQCEISANEGGAGEKAAVKRLAFLEPQIGAN